MDHFFFQKETTLCENFFRKFEIDKRMEDKEQCFKIDEFYGVMDLIIG